MANEITIPCLPCGSIDETLTFYVALGFEITYQQTRPNTYACVKYEDIELHFFAMKGVVPANSYSTCIVLVQDADTLYATFASNLRRHFSKLPVAGIPRITKPNNKNVDGDWRFNVIDPGGNYIRFVQKASNADQSRLTEPAATKFSRALFAAELLVNSKGDFPAAAKMLDAALARDEQDVTAVQRIQALVLRAEVAANMNDLTLARKLLTNIRQMPLGNEDRMSLLDELQRLDELAQLLA